MFVILEARIKHLGAETLGFYKGIAAFFEALVKFLFE